MRWREFHFGVYYHQQNNTSVCAESVCRSSPYISIHSGHAISRRHTHDIPGLRQWSMIWCLGGNLVLFTEIANNGNPTRVKFKPEKIYFSGRLCHWLMQWFAACSAPDFNLNKWRFIVNQTCMNKLRIVGHFVQASLFRDQIYHIQFAVNNRHLGPLY